MKHRFDTPETILKVGDFVIVNGRWAEIYHITEDDGINTTQGWICRIKIGNSLTFNNEKPIVFLDIDGVLNSTDHAINRKNPNERRPENLIDERAVEFLNEIYDWNFVLSSSWRKYNTLEEVNHLLWKKGFEGEILDKTPSLAHPCLRGNEIYAWIDSHIMNSSDFDNYVIFDDDSDFLLWQKDHFMHIDGYFGIGPNHIYRAKRLLSNAKQYTLV